MTLHGRRVRVAGRVAMQMTCLDVGPLYETGKEARPGDSAFVLGGPGDAISVQELAGWWGTIPHEVTCLLGKNRAL
jgi:alanine racemase